MSWRFLLVAGIVHLLAASAASQFEADTEDRFVQSFSPDLEDNGSNGAAKPRLIIETSEVKFSRASVEAAPDTIEVPSFSQKADAYTIDTEDATPFNRQFIEAGSLKPYGAAELARYSSPVNPVAYLYLGRLDQDPSPFKYYGAAAPYSASQSAATPYFAATYPAANDISFTPQQQYYNYLQSYRAFPAVPGPVKSTGEVAHPLRSAVEHRPVTSEPYQARSMDLEDLRRKYEAAHDQPFVQSRQDPNHKAGSKHYERLAEINTRSKYSALRIK